MSPVGVAVSRLARSTVAGSYNSFCLRQRCRRPLSPAAASRIGPTVRRWLGDLFTRRTSDSIPHSADARSTEATSHDTVERFGRMKGRHRGRATSGRLTAQQAGWMTNYSFALSSSVMVTATSAAGSANRFALTGHRSFGGQSVGRECHRSHHRSVRSRHVMSIVQELYVPHPLFSRHLTFLTCRARRSRTQPRVKIT